MLKFSLRKQPPPFPNPTTLSAPLRRRHLTPTDTATPLVSCHDEIYYANVTIGGQVTQLIVDTGSADTWVKRPKYLPESSSSSLLESGLPPFSIQYVDGDGVSGTHYSDDVSFSPFPSQNQSSSAQSHAFRQTLAVVSDLSTFKIICVEDGLMGFAFQSVSRNDIPTPIQNLYEQQKIDNMQFGFYVSSSNQNSADSVGEITLGGYDESRYHGGLTFVPVALRSLREMYPNDDLSHYSAAQRHEVRSCELS
jgi:hypothetical protein